MAVRSDYGKDDLGPLLRNLRKSLALTLAEIAQRAHLDSSTLSRYERGGRIPVKYAELLDLAYQGHGVVATALVNAYGEPWRPPIDRKGQHLHVHRWPAEHRGKVWLHIVPDRRTVLRDHTLELDWGSWSRRVDLPQMSGAGKFLWTGKGPDGDAVDINCHVEPKAHIMFGVNEPPSPAEDIRWGWIQRE